MKKFLILVLFMASNATAQQIHWVYPVTQVRNVYSSTNVTTGSYVQMVASTGMATTEIDVFDSSGQTLILATGASGSESAVMYIVPGGNGHVPLFIPSGSRVSVKALSGTANTGELDINFFN